MACTAAGSMSANSVEDCSTSRPTAPEPPTMAGVGAVGVVAIAGMAVAMAMTWICAARVAAIAGVAMAVAMTCIRTARIMAVAGVAVRVPMLLRWIAHSSGSSRTYWVRQQPQKCKQMQRDRHSLLTE